MDRKPIRQDRSLTQESFDGLLRWLDPDRERAGMKYEEIRHGLVEIFARRGCLNAEELADETIDRVAFKVKEIVRTYNGDPVLYFHRVARTVYIQYSATRPDQSQGLHPNPRQEAEHLSDALSRWKKLDNAESRQFIVRYYPADITQQRSLAH